MNTINDVQEPFASFFKEEQLQPWAWYLSKRLSEGHICVPVNDGSIFKSGQPFEIKPDAEKLRDCLRYVSTDSDVVRPFVLFNDKIYVLIT